MKAGNRSTGPVARLRAGVAAAGAVLVLAACSSLQLGYRHADTLLLVALDRYFALDDAQKALARARARALLDWHRATELRDYAALLEAAQTRLGAPVSTEDVLAWQNDLYARAAALGERAAPEVAALAQTLTPAQLERFARRLAQDTAKARRELARFAGRESLEDRIERYVERVESWFGYVDARQRELIRAALATQPDQQWWIEERQRRQQDLLAVLARIQREQPGAATATQWLREYFAELALPAERERAERLLAFRRANAELIARLINSASDEQRATLLRKLRGYAQDFMVLASSG